MTMFDALDIAEFDDLVEETSPDTAAIQRDTGAVDDGHGGQTETWTTVATVACGVGSPEQPTERSIADALQGDVGVMITVPRGTDVKNTDRIVVNASQTYEVIGVAPSRSYESRRRVLCRAIT